MHIATKRGLDAAKTASKKVVYKAAEATGKLIVNKIAKIVEPKSMSEVNSRNLEEIFISSDKRQGILNNFRQTL